MMSCKELAKKYFPEKDYDIRRVTRLTDTKGASSCMVDYYDNHVHADIDIEAECDRKCGYGFDFENKEEEKEFKKCMDECEKELEASVRTNLVGSVMFDENSLKVEAATLPVNCSYVWLDEYDVEEQEEKIKKMTERFKDIGCALFSDWIHGHELAGNDEDETSPAICYLHPQAVGKCRVDAVLRVLRGLK